MIWLDSKERAAACNAILSVAGIGPCFDEERGAPTDLGVQLRPFAVSAPDTIPSRFDALSDGERCVVRFAWDVWMGAGRFDLAEALTVLDGPNLRVLGRFLLALSEGGHEAMESFIKSPTGGVRQIVKRGFRRSEDVIPIPLRPRPRK